jgi:hypothetical protein
MNTAVLPVFLQRGTATLTFALGIFLVAGHAVLTTLAAQRSTLGARDRALAPWLVASYLAIWLAAGLLVGDDASFPLSHPDLSRPLSLAVGFGPMLIAAALLRTSKTLRALNAAMPGEWLIRIQAYRMGGLMFLFPFLYFGLVPAAFAIPAAIGDFLTGLAAPFVASAVAHRRPGALAWAVAWNIFGIVDLIVAPTAAVLSQAQVLTIYPLSLVPLFMGPPLGILMHLYSLRNLHTGTRREEVHGSTSAADPVGAT